MSAAPMPESVAIVECPRCGSPGPDQGASVSCPEHGDVVPLRLSRRCDYAAVVAALEMCGDFPLLRPEPVVEWSLVLTGLVRPSTTEGGVTGSVTSWVRSPWPGAPVARLDLVTEEPGVGMGARIAGLDGLDAGGAERDQPIGRIAIGSHHVPMWSAAHAHDGRSEPLDRFALFGEHEGRWCWLVLWPGAAALDLIHGLAVDQLDSLGPRLVELSYASMGRDW